jgi:penicillin-binding protein 1A
VYLYRGQPASDREPISPFLSFATGANEMSTLDMAAGMQTIANEGLHQEPYYVEFIDDVNGERIYTHRGVPRRELDRGVALKTIDVLKSVPSAGTARGELADFARLRPTAGKTGTQDFNTTSWYVGSTPFLTTAVLVRDPDRYTPMENIPEFRAIGIEDGRVQGGRLPARIWEAYMSPAHVFEPVTDWAKPPRPERGAARLYLPGNECLFRVVATTPTTTVPDGAEPAADAVTERVVEQEEPTPTAQPPAESPTDSASTTVAPPRLVPVESGTTIAPDVLDPNAPLPSVAASTYVAPCR